MTDDKRSYFRIDDNLKVSWVPVLDDGRQSEAESNAEMRELNEQLSALISLAFQHSAPVGEALGLLNRKLDLLTKSHNGSGNVERLVRVNISGAGIGFHRPTPADPGQVIDLTLILKPSNATVCIRGEVLRCDSDSIERSGYWIRVAFVAAQDTQVEQVVQHVSFRQTERLASQRRRAALDDELHPHEDD